MSGAEGGPAAKVNIKKVKRLLNAVLSKIKVGSNSRGASQPTPPEKLAIPEPLNPLSTLLGKKFGEYIGKKNAIIKELNKPSSTCILLNDVIKKSNVYKSNLLSLSTVEQKFINNLVKLLEITIEEFEKDSLTIESLLDNFEFALQEIISSVNDIEFSEVCLNIIQYYIISFVINFSEVFIEIIIDKIEAPDLVPEVLEASNNATGIKNDLDDIILNIITTICNLFPNKNKLTILQKVLIETKGITNTFYERNPHLRGKFAGIESRFTQILDLKGEFEYTGTCAPYTRSGRVGGKAKKKTRKQKKKKQKLKSGKKNKNKSKRRKGSRKK